MFHVERFGAHGGPVSGSVAVPRWPGPGPVTEFRSPWALSKGEPALLEPFARDLRRDPGARRGRSWFPLSLAKGHHERI
jgi:hypothetical protein